MAAFTAAANAGDWKNAPNFAVSLIDTAGAEAWPIVSATFILLPKDPKDPARSANVIKFFDWAYKNGGDIAKNLEYIALPAAVQDAVRAAWRAEIKGPDGAADLVSSAPAPRLACDGRRLRAPPALSSHRGNDFVSDAAAAFPLRATGARAASFGDRLFACLATAAGVFVLVLLGAIIVSLFIGGLPSFRAFGLDFLVDTDWDPVQHVFGAGVPIFGTLVTSVLALLMAVPLAFGIAFYLTELAPAWFRRPVGTAIELLAAVPSIIYGMWGFFVIVPVMGDYVQPFLTDWLGDVPGDRLPVPGRAVRHRHPHRRAGAGGDDHPVHRRHHARRVQHRAGGVQGIRLRRRLHHLGGDAQHRHSLHPRLGGGRHHAGAGPRAGRDDGGDLRDRQHQPHHHHRCSARATPSPRSWRWNFPKARPGSLKLSSLLALGFILFVISFIVLAISRLLLRPRSA